MSFCFRSQNNNDCDANVTICVYKDDFIYAMGGNCNIIMKHGHGIYYFEERKY
jgi:hypothetical protein